MWCCGVNNFNSETVVGGNLLGKSECGRCRNTEYRTPIPRKCPPLSDVSKKQGCALAVFFKYVYRKWLFLLFGKPTPSQINLKKNSPKIIFSAGSARSSTIRQTDPSHLMLTPCLETFPLKKNFYVSIKQV